MSAKIPQVIADFEVQLATAIAIGGTTFSISSIIDDDGNTIPDGLYCLTIDNDSTNKEYLIGTMTAGAFSGVSSVSRQGSLTSGATQKHRVGAPVIITDFLAIQLIANILRGTTTLDGGSPLSYDTAPTLSDGKQLATVAYVLGVVTGGAVTFSSQIINGTYGETITAGQPVYFKESDQKWHVQHTNDTTTITQVISGIAQSNGNASDSKPILLTGLAANFTSLTVGSKYYATDAGGVSTTPGTNSYFIGWAVNSTTILVDSQSIYTPSAAEKAFLSIAATSGVGILSPYAGRVAPSGYLLCDGSTVSRSTYAALFGVICPSLTFTVTIASPGVFTTSVNHGLVAGDKLHFTTTGGLPSGLATNTDYYVIAAGLTSTQFEVALTPGGAAVNTSGSQSGTHTLYMSAWGKGDGSTTFALPDLRSKVAIGLGIGSSSLSFESAAVNTSTDQVAILNSQFPSQGQAVQLTTSGTLPTGLSPATTYYIIRVDSTHIAFASSLANANAGSQIDLTGAGSGVHTLTYTDIGGAVMGDNGGEEYHGIATTELAAHTHPIPGSGGGSGGFNTTSISTSAGVNTLSAGGNSQHNNMQPFARMNYIIKY